MQGRIVTVGNDRQLALVGADGRNRVRLTWDLAADPLLRWSRAELRSSAFSWPTWSPDGTRLAALELPTAEDSPDPARVHVLDADGVRQVVQLETPGRVPLAALWRPDGRGLAVLTQDESQLELTFTELDRPGHARPMEAGGPLFFSWAPDRRRLLAHTGRPGGAARLVAVDSQGEWPDTVALREPGSFCTPIVVGPFIAHVERGGAVNRLVTSRSLEEPGRPLLEFAGLCAIMPGPAGEVLVSVAPGGQGTPYRGVTRFDLRTGASRRISEEDCLAFFWSDPSHQLVYVQVDAQKRGLVWKTVRAGEEPSELCRFWPSRDQLYHLHYFEQLALSHAPLAPDGTSLVYAGFTLDESPRGGNPSVFVKDLTSAAPAEAIAEGGFGCFAPTAFSAAGSA